MFKQPLFGWKLFRMVGNGWKLFGRGWKLLKMVGNGWNCLKICLHVWILVHRLAKRMKYNLWPVCFARFRPIPIGFGNHMAPDNAMMGSNRLGRRTATTETVKRVPTHTHGHPTKWICSSNQRFWATSFQSFIFFVFLLNLLPGTPGQHMTILLTVWFRHCSQMPRRIS